MTQGTFHPGGEVPADELAVTKAELTMARLVDGRFENSAGNGALVTMVVVYAALTIAGVWLRTRVVPAGWEVAAGCALITVLPWAGPLLGRVTGRKRKPPGWVTSAEICERALAGRIPGPVTEAVSEAITRIRERGGNRWHGVYVYLSRCTSTQPPDTGACQNAAVVPMSGRLVVMIGEHMAGENPAITRAVLAHESQHVRPVRLYLARLGGTARLIGWVLIGWAVPWPALLPALLAFHLAAMLLWWLIESSCDLGGAADAGADAMLTALIHGSQIAARISQHRSRWERCTRQCLIWASGATHPPLPLRRALVRTRRPQPCPR